MKGLSSNLVELKSIEDAQLTEIHKIQNSDACLELSEFLDLESPWIPLTISQLKSKIEEMQKEERKSLFGIWSRGNEFLGLVSYDTSWDTWAPFFSVFIWPQHRRKGWGSAAAKMILEGTFEQSIAHAVGSYVSEWNTVGLAFAESLGFKKAGIKRRAGVLEGRFYDGMFIDMLRDEYLASRSKEAGR